jgi:hypothetical protein
VRVLGTEPSPSHESPLSPRVPSAEKDPAAATRRWWRVLPRSLAASVAGSPAGALGRTGGKVGSKVVSRTIFWAPVWLPLIVLFQFTLLGLKPAQVEQRRLDREEAGILARVEALQGHHEHLISNRTRLADDVWRERVRRSLRNEGAEPLRLEHDLISPPPGISSGSRRDLAGSEGRE